MKQNHTNSEGGMAHRVTDKATVCISNRHQFESQWLHFQANSSAGLRQLTEDGPSSYASPPPTMGMQTKEALDTSPHAAGHCSHLSHLRSESVGKRYLSVSSSVKLRLSKVVDKPFKKV